MLLRLLSAAVPRPARRCHHCRSGPPISQVARAWRKGAPAAVSAAASRLLEGAAAAASGAGHGGAGGGAAAAAAVTDQLPLTQAMPGPSFEAFSAEQPTAGEEAQSAAAGAARGAKVAQPLPPQVQGQGSGVKKARPSSWQRRRAAKQQQQQQQQQAGDAPEAMQLDSSGERVVPATQGMPASQEPQAAPGGSGAAAPAGAGNPAAVQPAPGEPAAARSSKAGGGAAGWWPPRMPRPSDMMLQRSNIFYCASFPRKPGLTTQRKQGVLAAAIVKHGADSSSQGKNGLPAHPVRPAPAADMLSKLRGAQQADRSLYAAIFDAKHSPGGGASVLPMPCGQQ